MRAAKAPPPDLRSGTAATLPRGSFLHGDRESRFPTFLTEDR